MGLIWGVDVTSHQDVYPLTTITHPAVTMISVGGTGHRKGIAWGFVTTSWILGRKPGSWL